MFHALSNQLYRYEHGLSAAEQRVADVCAGEAAAGRLHSGEALTLRDGGWSRLLREIRYGRHCRCRIGLLRQHSNG